MNTRKVKYGPNKSISNAEYYDYSADFMILSVNEKQVILKTAKNLLKQQKENSIMLFNASILLINTENRGLV